MTRSPNFWNKVADKYARRPVDDQQSYEHKLKTTQMYLHPDMALLEFGCGTGSTALVHAPFVKSILALDFSPRMIDIALGKAADQAVSNVQFEVGSIESYAAPDAHFDAVLGMSVMHLLEDKDAVIAKVFKTLKPGGLFVSSTVCIDEIGPIKWVLPLAAMLGLAPPLDAFSAAELVASLVQAGFEIEHQWRPGPSKAVFMIARKP